MFIIINIRTVNETSGQREVAMLQPFARKDLIIRSLPDRLNDCPQMLYLYPDIPKVPESISNNRVCTYLCIDIIIPTSNISTN